MIIDKTLENNYVTHCSIWTVHESEDTQIEYSVHHVKTFHPLSWRDRRGFFYLISVKTELTVIVINLKHVIWRSSTVTHLASAKV